MAIPFLEEIERAAEFLGKRVMLSGFVFVYPDPDWDWESDPDNELFNDSFYIARELDQWEDRLDLCVLLEHLDLEEKIQRSRVKAIIGGKYGKLCHPCEATGTIQRSTFEPFSFSLSNLKSLVIWNPPLTDRTAKRKS